MLAAALQPQRRTIWLGVLFALVAVAAAVLLIGLSGWFITGAALAGLSGAVAVQAFNYLIPSAMIRLLAILRTLSRYGERLASHHAALLALARFRSQLFNRLMTSHSREVMALSAGDAAAHLVQDVDALEDMIVRKPALPTALLGGGLGLALTALAGVTPALTLAAILLAVVPLAFVISRRFLVVPARRLSAATALLKSDFVDYASASAEIVAYSLGSSVHAALDAHIRQIDAARRELAFGEAALTALLTLAAGVAMAAVLYFSQASLPITVLASFAAAGSIEAQGAYVRSIGRNAGVQAGLDRLSKLIALSPSAQQSHLLAGHVLTLPDGAGTRLIRMGERLNIVGRSGSGKTRLLESLTGLQLDMSGRICVDDVPVSACRMDDLGALFALSPQNAQMISGTIAENCRLARAGIREDDIWSALTAANFDLDVRAMPLGLETWVGDGGAQLSGGQRKRLSLARALLANRPWLLLDEPSEGLDPETEQEMARRLDAWITEAGCGLILVSHRTEIRRLANDTLNLQ
eukprot:gene15315-15460_t